MGDSYCLLVPLKFFGTDDGQNVSGRHLILMKWNTYQHLSRGEQKVKRVWTSYTLQARRRQNSNVILGNSCYVRLKYMFRNIELYIFVTEFEFDKTKIETKIDVVLLSSYSQLLHTTLLERLCCQSTTTTKKKTVHSSHNCEIKALPLLAADVGLFVSGWLFVVNARHKMLRDIRWLAYGDTVAMLGEPVK